MLFRIWSGRGREKTHRWSNKRQIILKATIEKWIGASGMRAEGSEEGYIHHMRLPIKVVPELENKKGVNSQRLDSNGSFRQRACLLQHRRGTSQHGFWETEESSMTGNIWYGAWSNVFSWRKAQLKGLWVWPTVVEGLGSPQRCWHYHTCTLCMIILIAGIWDGGCRRVSMALLPCPFQSLLWSQQKRDLRPSSEDASRREHVGSSGSRAARKTWQPTAEEEPQSEGLGFCGRHLST